MELEHERFGPQHCWSKVVRIIHEKKMMLKALPVSAKTVQVRALPPRQPNLSGDVGEAR